MVEDDVVAECLSHGVIAGLGDVDRCPLPLIGCECGHECQALVLFVLQHGRAFVLTAFSDHWFRAHERGRHHHLITQDEVVDDEMMPVELPSPGICGGRRAHHREVVQPLAVLVEVLAQLGEMVIEPHDVARLLEPSGAQ